VCPSETVFDETAGLAARWRICFFALAPKAFQICSVFGTDPAKNTNVYHQSFMPPDPKVQDIPDTAMASVVVTGSSGPFRKRRHRARIYLALSLSPPFPGIKPHYGARR
jgi:hypothetical protein